jgi:hypothetical protein
LEYANYPDGCYKFVGQWKNDKRLTGKCFFKNGQIWVGTFGRKRYNGSFIFDNNSTYAYYHGEFLDDKRYISFFYWGPGVRSWFFALIINVLTSGVKG